MEPAELGDDEVGVGRTVELNGDIGFETRNIGLFHRAAEVDRDLAIRLLEVDEPGKHPEIARSLRHRNAHGTSRVGGK